MAFTEQGVAMLSSALNTERAIQANTQISVGVHIPVQQMRPTHEDLRRKN
jgi:hypothetical protein